MKCLVCNTELRKGAKKCPNCGFVVNKQSEDDLKTSQMFSDRKKLDKDKYHTIVLLQEQLDSIRELLDEDEKKEKDKTKKSSNKKVNNKKKEKTIDEKTKDELVQDIERISKELEEVDKDIEENKEFIELIRSEEEKEKKEKIENSKKRKEEKTLEERILMTDHIDKIADAISDEISDSIASSVNKANIEVEFQSKKSTKSKKEKDLDKTKEFEIDLSKTIAINSLGNTKELDRFSLIDDINNQIDEANRKAKEEKAAKEDNLIVEDVEVEKNIEELNNSIDTRRKVLVFTGVAVLVLVFTLVAIWFATEPNFNNKKAVVDPLNQITEEMKNYYNTSDIDNILYLLEDIKNDKELVTKFQAKTRTICDSWVLLYLNEEVDSKDSFEKSTAKYKELLDGLYRYAIVKNDNGLVRALTEKDYNDLLIQFDNIYSDSVIFYDALELYNENDYNKAYYMFNKIDSTNSYYEKSVTYSNKILDDIIATLLSDIEKLEANIDSYDNARKLEIYSNIEQIIIDYNSVYSNIDLTSNEDYQEILSKYTSRVSEYTEKVLNDFSSQGSVT